MNIFEQYGIKEVADVTLYAIELDKYDEEVYIPVLYFDTLKVSTIEQTAEQSSARGGVGNPSLITWDYGKEISVTLEDALYTPASQSLMWGGKFGTKTTKIYGAWNPYIYEKDDYGRSQYVNRKVITEEEYQSLSTKEQKSFHCFICPCDGQRKYEQYKAGNFKKLWGDVEGVSDGDKIVETQKLFGNREKDGENYGSKSFNVYYTYNNPQLCELEKAELIIDNFGAFDFHCYEPTDKKESEGQYIWEDVTPINNVPPYCESDGTIFEYIWKNSDIKMISLEGSQDVYSAENISIRYLKDIVDQKDDIQITTSSLYDYERTNSNYDDPSEDKLLQERFRYKDQDTGMYVVDEKITGIKISDNNFGKRIEFYKDFLIELTDCGGELYKEIVRIPVGEFFIVEEWNAQISSVEEWIHPIDSGLEDVEILERMEKCKASQTFVISTNRNTRMNNLKDMPEYAGAEITVYIDPKTMKPFEPNTTTFTRKNGQEITGNLRVIKQYEIYYKFTRSKAPKYTTLGHQITVDAIHYPGTYRLVGTTYARSRKDGKDQRYQFEIPLCKMSSETNLTLEAAGDPTTFTMNMQVLRREDGVMMKITQYDVDTTKYDSYKSGSTTPIPSDGVIDDNPDYEESGVR